METWVLRIGKVARGWRPSPRSCPHTARTQALGRGPRGCGTGKRRRRGHRVLFWEVSTDGRVQVGRHRKLRQRGSVNGGAGPAQADALSPSPEGSSYPKDAQLFPWQLLPPHPEQGRRQSVTPVQCPPSLPRRPCKLWAGLGWPTGVKPFEECHQKLHSHCIARPLTNHSSLSIALYSLQSSCAQLIFYHLESALFGYDSQKICADSRVQTNLSM